VRRAVATAERVCAAKEVNLTPLRRHILEIVWRQHEPIGAYEILAELARDREKAAPPTLQDLIEYRVLDLSDATALATDQELSGVSVFRSIASQERIERVQAMHEPGLLRKLQCSIHGTGSPPAAR
jgi:Fe2+ or Zn2+ uptake regulation protein